MWIQEYNNGAIVNNNNEKDSFIIIHVGPINLTFIRIEYINDDNVTIEQQNITYNISNGREINRLSNKYIY